MTRGPLASSCRVAAAIAIVTASGVTSASAAAIFGTLSNFDIYNTTPEPSEGAQIELEGVHSSSFGGDFPAHYGSRTVVEYNDDFNNFAGTRITYTGYNFAGAPTPGSLVPNPNPTSTNGHALTYTAGGEHFGFWLNGEQPTATRFFWLNDNGGTYERIGIMPESVPGPTWTYQPPANPGEAPIVEAVVRVPEPEVHFQNPDSIWMKVFKTEMGHAEHPQDLLEHLVSGDPNDPNVIVPQEPAETETEWELLEGGKNNGEANPNGGLLDDKDNEVVLFRYEFYKFTGEYDEEHEPISNWEGNGDPFDIGERGDFIAANMVAAILVELPAPAAAGDFDENGSVNGADLISWNTGFGTTGTATHMQGDADGDHDVDGGDFLVWQQQLGIGPVVANSGQIPEPSALVMVLLAGCGWALRRTRRALD